MNSCFLLYYYLPLNNSSKRYYNSIIKIMDYISREGFKEEIIYIINIDNFIYKIYDSGFSAIFICDFSEPELLLNAVLNLLPKKIVLLTPLGKKISRTLMLLFDCIA